MRSFVPAHPCAARGRATAADIVGDTYFAHALTPQRGFEFETFFSLSCQNCPDVVQALNLMSIINPRIKHVAVSPDGVSWPETLPVGSTKASLGVI